MTRRAVFLLVPLLLPLPALAQTTSGAGSCNQPILTAEQQYSLPKGILYAIATVESVFRDPQTGVRAPWPWTVNVAGSGRYYPSLNEAKKAVVKALASNVDSVDVGCMQVNLRAHPEAFSSLDLAFDPATNVNYAAQLLQSNFFDSKSWSEAIRRYHAPAGSPNGALYLSKVMAYWRGSLGLPDNPLREVADETPKPLDLAAQDFAKGNYEIAQARYQGILKADPDSRIAHLGLAMCAEKLGDPQTAEEHYLRVLVYDPYNRAAQDRLLGLYAPLAPALRIQKLGGIRKLVPDDATLPALISDAYVELGNLTEAARSLSAALKLDDGQALWRLNLASLYDRLGDKHAAIAEYRRFLKDYRPEAGPLPVAIADVERRLTWLRNN